MFAPGATIMGLAPHYFSPCTMVCDRWAKVSGDVTR